MGYEPLYHALQIFWCIFIFILFFYILGTLLMKQLPLTTQTLADKPYSFTQNFCNKLGIQLICNKYQRKVKHMFKSVNISCSYNYKAKIMGEGVTYSLFSMLVSLCRFTSMKQWYICNTSFSRLHFWFTLGGKEGFYLMERARLRRRAVESRVICWSSCMLMLPGILLM